MKSSEAQRRAPNGAARIRPLFFEVVKDPPRMIEGKRVQREHIQLSLPFPSQPARGNEAKR